MPSSEAWASMVMRGSRMPLGVTSRVVAVSVPYPRAA